MGGKDVGILFSLVVITLLFKRWGGGSGCGLRWEKGPCFKLESRVQEIYIHYAVSTSRDCLLYSFVLKSAQYDFMQNQQVAFRS